MTIIKQGMSDWMGKHRKITSYNNLKLSSSERLWHTDKGYIFCESISVCLLQSKWCLIEPVFEYESVSLICVQENFYE